MPSRGVGVLEVNDVDASVLSEVCSATSCPSYQRLAAITSSITNTEPHVSHAIHTEPANHPATNMSPNSSTAEKITQIYIPNPSATEPANTQAVISALNLQVHVEGGYYAEIDRNPLTIPNPFLVKNGGDEEDDVKNTAEKPMSGDNAIRNASTSIYYMLSAVNPQGHFHRNKGRTVRMTRPSLPTPVRGKCKALGTVPLLRLLCQLAWPRLAALPCIVVAGITLSSTA